MKNIVFSLIMIELFINLSLVAEGVRASEPPQTSLPENYPQITRSSICNINVLPPNFSRPITFLNFILREGISTVTSMPGSTKIPTANLEAICAEQRIGSRDQPSYILPPLRVDSELSIRNLGSRSSLIVVCNPEDKPSNFMNVHLPRDIGDHCSQ